MPTLRQIEANRLNAQRSTGPKTDQGKAISSLNNLKHGLRAATVVLPMENKEDFDREYQDLLDHCQPDGPIEHHLVEQMVDYRWKSIRSNEVVRCQLRTVREDAKKPLYNLRVENPAPEDIMLRLGWEKFRVDIEHLEVMQQRYDRAYLRAERRLAQIQKERRQRAPQVEQTTADPEKVGSAPPPANLPSTELPP